MEVAEDTVVLLRLNANEHQTEAFRATWIKIFVT